MNQLLPTILLLMLLILIIIVSKLTDSIGNLFIKLYILIRNLKLHIKSRYDSLDSMNREIDVTYSPAVASYIYNTKLEPKKDILATILNLYNKKVLIIQKTNTGYNFIPNHDENLNNLSADEKYIYNFLIKNKEDVKNFSPDEWKKIVIEECVKNGYNKEIKYEINNKILNSIVTILDIITVFLFGKSLNNANLFKGSESFAFWGILILFGITNWAIIMLPTLLCYDKLLYIKLFLTNLTQNGKNEIIKWIKFKEFIKNYTLINERKIEEIVIYEKYIPYAMMLGINKEYNNDDIKDFVSDYMNLVDKNVKNYLYTDFFV